MKFITIYLIALILYLLSFQTVQASEPAFDRLLLEYYGSDHSEALITLDAYAVIEQQTPPTKINLDPIISSQMRFMLGLMRSRTKEAAALYPKWSYVITEVKAQAPGRYLVRYTLNTKGVFPHGKLQYTFILPVNPKKVFAAAEGKCHSSPSEDSNFWYHWEPAIPGCPLKENVDFYMVNTTIRPLANTTISYPEYAKLPDAGRLIRMTMFFGFEKYGFQNWTPQGGEDWGIKGFKQQQQFLTSLGFTETVLDAQQVALLYKAKDRFIPYISEFSIPGSTANIRIRLILLDTGYNHNSTAFHLLFKDALAKESVIFYNGHSGIGHNLDLAAIEKLRAIRFVFNPKYQILFLGSCVPYSYYTEMFFNRKKSKADPAGSLNLDIMSYGKETIFGNVEDQALIKALTKYATTGEKQSYQAIIKSSPNYFFGVNGDEDNLKE